MKAIHPLGAGGIKRCPQTIISLASWGRYSKMGMLFYVCTDEGIRGKLSTSCEPSLEVGINKKRQLGQGARSL